jgi:N6-L-threonylcarbamoyladenine synthase
MRILAIESSCDETAAAVVEDGRRVLSSIVASQDELHAETGGVVPEVAARQHLRALVPVVRRALAEASCDWDAIDAVAATAGPGLPGALAVGFAAARAIAFARGLPLIPADHIEGHVCANWLGEEEPPLPALALVVSGGHTELLLMEDHGRFRRLGGTRDDAAGEAFDKVARMLGLGYPGGPPISRLAQTAERRELRLPRAWMPGSDDFSFSGLKTAVLLVVRGAKPPPPDAMAWQGGACRRARGRRLAAGRGRPRRAPAAARTRPRARRRARLHSAARALHGQRRDDRRGRLPSPRRGRRPGGSARHRSHREARPCSNRTDGRRSRGRLDGLALRRAGKRRHLCASVRERTSTLDGGVLASSAERRRPADSMRGRGIPED